MAQDSAVPVAPMSSRVSVLRILTVLLLGVSTLGSLLFLLLGSVVLAVGLMGHSQDHPLHSSTAGVVRAATVLETTCHPGGECVAECVTSIDYGQSKPLVVTSTATDKQECPEERNAGEHVRVYFDPDSPEDASLSDGTTFARAALLGLKLMALSGAALLLSFTALTLASRRNHT